MRVLYRDEDPTTEKLADLLRASRTVLSSFLRFLFSDQQKIQQLVQLPLKIDTQRSFSEGKSGRLNLLLHHGSVGIIVECKTRDQPKIFQLEKYHKYWLAKYKETPSIFWLVRRSSKSLGINPYLTDEKLWNQLNVHLLGHLKDEPDPIVRMKIKDFCIYLDETNILISGGEQEFYQPRDRGYDYHIAEEILEKIGQQLDDSSFEVAAPMNGVTHRLFIGKECWLDKFHDGCFKRICLQFKPDRQSGLFFCMVTSCCIIATKPLIRRLQ